MKDIFFTFLKAVIALLFIPILAGISVGFYHEIMALGTAARQDLFYGALAYIVSFLFVYDFSHLYHFGQKVVSYCFSFVKPIVSVASYSIPMYTVIVLIVFSFFQACDMVGQLQGVFYFLFAATFMMHMILTAQALYKEDGTLGKPTYAFHMALIYVFDVVLIALIMSAAVPGFSFVHFFKKAADVSLDFYQVILGQLF